MYLFKSHEGLGTKLKLFTHVYDIDLYVNYFFQCHCVSALVSMATCFYRLSGNWHLLLHDYRYFEKKFYRNFSI